MTIFLDFQLVKRWQMHMTWQIDPQTLKSFVQHEMCLHLYTHTHTHAVREHIFSLCRIWFGRWRPVWRHIHINLMATDMCRRHKLHIMTSNWLHIYLPARVACNIELLIAQLNSLLRWLWCQSADGLYVTKPLSCT